MIRTIILLRHGESAEIEPGQRDFDRVLTAKGEASIRQLAAKLVALKIFPDRVLCSPALRTKQTASILLAEMKLTLATSFEYSIYNGGVVDYFDFLEQSAQVAHCVLMVGHNPTISGLMNHLGIKHFLGFAPGQAAVLQVEKNLRSCALRYNIEPF